MSLPWEGFSHRNSRMSVHPGEFPLFMSWMDRGCRAPVGAAANKLHAAATAFTPMERLGGMACGRGWCEPGAAMFRERAEAGGR